MKTIKLLIPALFFLLFGCRTSSDFSQVVEDLQENFDFGNLSTVIQIADSLHKIKGENKKIIHIADSMKLIAERISIDFSITEDQVVKQIEKLNGPVSSIEKLAWEKNGWLEFRIIDGGKKYFKRAATNLILMKKFREQREKSQSEAWKDPAMIVRLNHTEEVLKSSDNQNYPVVPVKMNISYTITVHPDVVPEGEKIRCWMPWPKGGLPRQKEIKLISTSSPEYLIAADSATHSTIYMEAVSKKGIPTVFQISFDYTSEAQHYNMPDIKILPYDKTSSNYLKYTSEQLPNICFTDNVKQLADSITGIDNDPASIVRKIYLWFKDNIPWAGALEYSIMPNIPEYVIQYKRGDCGMQTFLFMSMLRYKGIPVRWQSGWMMPPDNENLHDWCEVYYEGTGWVPVDVSYDLQNSENPLLKYFYLSGVDSYRLIVNQGVAGPLQPVKIYMRSEPNDFQRGEVEWKGGNLYFDKWDYNMKIEYLK